MSKRETVEEFLARGGQVTKCPAQERPDEESRTNPTTTASSTMMTLAEGALFYSESKAKKERKKKAEKEINLDALPPHLRKYIPKKDD